MVLTRVRELIRGTTTYVGSIAIGASIVGARRLAELLENVIPIIRPSVSETSDACKGVRESLSTQSARLECGGLGDPARGNVNQNVLPLPSCDCRPTSPPCPSTKRFTVASPSPSPSRSRLPALK